MKRIFSFLACLGGLALGVVAPAAESGFGYESLRTRARESAARPYAPPQGEVPQWLRELDYDGLRRIAFDGRQTVWMPEKLPFQLQFLHPGFVLNQMVKLSALHDGRVAPLPYRREYFDFRGITPGPTPPGMGFAGFRVMYPFDGHGKPLEEIGSFAGASYFRFLPDDAAYGLSARGLAIDTAEPKPEEFPRFTEFWIVRPEPKDRSLVVLALLESESVAGAYRFTIAPGPTTVMQVQASLYARKNPKVLGAAPLTSMFWHGENSNEPTRDFRPEVHDSDGLLVHNGAGEWLWRPLVNPNPRGVRVSTFSDTNPRGFGLLQRDRNFENYQDLEASYHARPSAWVEPVGDWGRGSVRLVEIPTTTEFDDNVVAFWTPDTLPDPGEPIEFEYRLHWFLDQIGPPNGRVRSTRHGKAGPHEPGLERFVVDFEGAELRRLTAEAKLEPVISVGKHGELAHATVQKNPLNGTWRVAFTVKPKAEGEPVELRCFLRSEKAALTETWSYLWQP